MAEEIVGELWASSFAPRARDPHSAARELLRSSLLRMRENVGELVSTIPADCKDLTVHNLSHLDALWEMASIVAGPDYQINPAEAFVLGGAILLHDSGMTVSAFPGGFKELTETAEWRDVAASAIRQAGLEPTASNIASPPPQLLDRIKFEVLRTLHAQQAERMATAEWRGPCRSSSYLLENAELRQAFGASIGRIAHSHHWDISRVAEDLSDRIGTSVSLPAEWDVNEKVVACILRCADIAHMDRRRAPTMLYAATNPQGTSGRHWGAQNRINKPAFNAGSMLYSSGTPYPADDAEAWWLAYDMIRSADVEIRNSNALLEEFGLQIFATRRVRGAESPAALSKHLKTDGWKPIDAEIRVSDPIHLAQTLGGSRLYGHDPLAPVRELLQNAADAVRARRELEGRNPSHGQIRITIEPASNDSSCWLHVDDNGIGMTERVLSGPLVDFGKSIWNSNLLREEFPGLQSKPIAPVGKFGIGFFSVFELAQQVAVISKKYDAAASDAKALEFKSISTRPLIRSVKAGELPQDFSTRVSVLVKDKARVTGIYGQRNRAGTADEVDFDFRHAVQKLVAMVDVNIEYNDIVTGIQFTHSHDVYGKEGDAFIDELLPYMPEKLRAVIRNVHKDLLQTIKTPTGKVLGRAAMYMLDDDATYARHRSLGSVSVGGFIYGRGKALPVSYVGVIEGETDQAARDYATVELPPEVIAQWATEQAAKVDQSRLLKGHLMGITERVITLGGDPGSLPYCFSAGQLISFSDFKSKVDTLENVILPMTLEYSMRFKLLGYDILGPNYFDLPLLDEVIVPRRSEERFIDDELARLITKQGREDIGLADLEKTSSTLRLLIDTLTDVWKSEPKVKVSWAQLFKGDVYSPPPTRWVLNLVRERRPRS